MAALRLWGVAVVLALCALPPLASAETIRSFDAALTVSRDGVVHVAETIAYDFEGAQKHGIYRDIPLSFNAEGVEDRGIRISHVVVTDAVGLQQQNTVTQQGNTLHIRIGDPEVLITGEHVYVVSYDVAGAVVPLADGEELYWNATGDGWDVPIERASADITLPVGTVPTTSFCYAGMAGSHERCAVATDGAVVHFGPTRPLAAHEGMTIATAFPQATVPVITVAVSAHANESFIERAVLGPGRIFIETGTRLTTSLPPMLFVVLGILIGLAGIAVAFSIWWYHGRDPRGRGTIIPYYEAPMGLTPMEAALIVRQKITGKDMTAELIALARHGAIRIAQEEIKTLGIFTSTDYRLIEAGGQGSLEAAHDRELYAALFYAAASENGVRSVLLSKVDKRFFQTRLRTIKDAARDAVVGKGLYDGSAKRYANTLILAGIGLFVLMFLSLIVSLPAAAAAGMLVLGLFVAGIALFVAAASMPRVTPQGALLRERLLGLKEYLQIAEKDRIAFHNAPEKRPETFEALLPMAILFGVEKAWAKEFKDVYVPPPTWYVGTDTAAFSAVQFSNDMHSFSGTFTSAIAVSASGAGGGGFAGGGAGGGGGGSW
jgi:hypothetical protein